MEGSALLVIKGLALTEENYEIAIDILKQRYENTQVVTSAHIDEMLKLPDCSGGKVHDLRKVYDKINVNVRGLEALGVKSEQYGSLLIPFVISKLPPELRIQIVRKTADELWKVDDILEIIRKELEAREIRESVRTNNPRFNDIHKHKEGWRQSRHLYQVYMLQRREMSERLNVSIVDKVIIQGHVNRTRLWRIERAF